MSSGSSPINWLDDWFDNLPVSGSSVNDDADRLACQPANRVNIAALLSDPEVRSHLIQSYQSLESSVGVGEAQQRVKHFVTEASWICRSQAKPPAEFGNPIPAKRSDLAKDLDGLAKQLRKLIGKVDALPARAKTSSSMEYLERRRVAGNRPGFIADRKGWNAQLRRREHKLSITEFLDCFASDIEEESCLINEEIEVKRQRSSRRAGIMVYADMLRTASLKLSTSECPDAKIVLAVITVLVRPAESLDESTLRKRFR